MKRNGCGWRSARLMGTTVVASLAMLAALLSPDLLVQQAAAAPGKPGKPGKPAASVKVVKHGPRGFGAVRPGPDSAGHSEPLPDQSLPHGRADADLEPGRWSRLSGLPLRVRAVGPGNKAPGAPGGVSAELAPVPGSSGSSGSSGSLVLQLVGVSASTEGSSASGASAGEVEVEVDYAGFRDVAAGDWGSRLRAWAMPACFATTPKKPGCGAATPVEAVNDPAAETLRFTLDRPAVSTAPEAPQAPEGGEPSTAPDQSEPGAPTEPSESTEPSSPSGSASSGDSASSEGGEPGPARAAFAAPTDPSDPSDPVEPVAGVEPTVILLAAAAEGEDGDFGATPLPPAGEWQVGEGSGEFSYSYPFDVPAPAVAGSAPSVGLSYSSGSVDGRNFATNGQVSQVGIGWELGAGGYIARSYKACSDDDDAWSGGDQCWATGSYDGTDRLVEDLSLVLGDRSSRLIQVNPGGDEFRLQDDPGWQVTRVRGDGTTGSPDNSDNDDEAFRVRTPDGGTFWFGWGHGSGSTSTVPVFGNDTGEPCHAATESEAWCQQGWRWGLDRAVDRHGNETTYTYVQERNYYSRYGDTANLTGYDRASHLSSIEYGKSRGGSSESASVVNFSTAPRCIAALTDASAACTGATGPVQDSQNWPDVPSDLICAAGETACANFGPSFFSTRRYDQITTSRRANGTTYPVDRYQLRFTLPEGANENGLRDLWLDSVQRTGLSGGGSQSLPATEFTGEWLRNRVVVDDGERPFSKLRITSVLNASGGRVDVTYGHATTTNAAGTAVDRTCDPAYVQGRERWDSTRECYATQFVPHGAPAGTEPSWEWWHKYVVTRLAVGDDALGYRFGQTPSSATSLGRLQVFDYEYGGTGSNNITTTGEQWRPENPAWRYVRNPQLPAEDETWDEWRGYGMVTIHTRKVNQNQKVVTNDAGDPVDVSARTVTRFRGIDGMPANDSGSESGDAATVAENVHTVLGGGPVADADWRNGQTAESFTTDGAGKPMARSYTSYASYETADSAAWWHSARYAYPRTSITQQRLTGAAGTAGEGPKVTTTTTIDDGGTDHRGVLLGAVTTAVNDQGTPNQAGDDVATCTSWLAAATGAANQRLRVPQENTIRAGSCTGEVHKRSRISYDGLAYGDAPTIGDATLTAEYADADTVIETDTDYDSYGRITRESKPHYPSDDPVWSTTVYNPGGDPDALISITKSTGPAPGPSSPGVAGLTTVLAHQPARGVTTKATDPNGQVATLTYDPLGRTTSVTNPGNDSGTPNQSFDYALSHDSPGRVTTSTLRSAAGGTPVTDMSSVFYDGWGRQIEAHTRNVNDTGWIVAATGYDEAGNTWLTIPATLVTGPAGAAGANTPANPDPATAPHYTTSTFDALGRVTTVADKSTVDGATTTNNTTLTQYTTTDGSQLTGGGVYADVVSVQPGSSSDPADSVTKTRTQSDALGRAVMVHQFGNGTSPDPSASDPRGVGGEADDGYATYTYTLTGQLDTITQPLPGTNADGNPTIDEAVWDYDYDWLDRRTRASDPDTGVVLTTYDAAGNVLTTDDPMPDTAADAGTSGGIVATAYDNLDRPIRRERVLDPGTDVEARTTLASWTYDQADNGLGLPYSSQTSDAANGGLGVFRTTTNAYDARGNALSVTSSYPADLTQEEPDTASNPDQPGTLDLASKTHTYGYNQLDQQTSIGYPEGAGLPAMTLTTEVGANGTYLGTRVASGSPAHPGEATYDDLDRPIGLASGATPVAANDTTALRRSYGYDHQDRLARQVVGTGPVDAQVNVQTFDYTYDTVGNPLRVTGTTRDPSSSSEADTAAWCYTYDGINRLTTARTGLPDTTGSSGCKQGTTSQVSPVTGARYDLGYTYSGGRLSSVKGTTPGLLGSSTQTATYTYPNPAGAADEETAKPHAVTDVSMGLLGGLLDLTDGVPMPGNLDYDAAGRIKTWTPDALLSGLTRGATTYTYDPMGNVQAEDGNGLLGLAGPVDGAYAYDADGMRAAAVHGSNLTNLVWDESVVYAGPTEITRDRVLILDGGARGRRVITTPGGTPLAVQEATRDNPDYAVWKWVNGNNADTITYTSSQGATGGEVHAYYPFGGEAGAAATPPADRGYLNKPLDPTGEIRLDKRNYDPRLDTLTTPDPLLEPGDPQTLNPYAYAGNNPIAQADPSGLRAVTPAGTEFNPYVPGAGAAAIRHDQAAAAAAQAAQAAQAHSQSAMGCDPAVLHDCGMGPVYDDPESHPWAGDKQAEAATRASIDTFLGYVKDLIFDTDQCDDKTSWSCAAEVAMVIPLFKAGKLIKIGDDVRDGIDALRDANKTRRHADDVTNGGANAVRKGQAGERAVRSAFDIGPKATRVINGRTRIFDGLNSSAVSEVKNVRRLSYTRQLRDYADYASRNGLRLDIYVRGGTKISGPLARADLDPMSPVNIIRYLE